MACCYDSCSNTRKKNPELTFFRFPKDKERRYVWMKKCNNASIQTLSFEELQNRVVCEEHFMPKCFDYSVLTSGKTRRSLFKFALPQPAHVVEAAKKEDEMFKNDLRNRPPFPLCKIEISPLSSNDTLQSRHKDLVSPQRLMNITENSCPLMRPISPLPMGGGDSEEGNYLSILPEVTLTTPFSPGGESNTEDESEDEFPSPTNSPLPSHLTPLLPPPIQPPESHITPYGGSMTSSVGTRSLNAGTTKALSQDWAALKSATKRPFECSTLSTEDINLNEPRARKYKKILPKRECDKNREDDIKFAYQKAVENIPPNNGGAGSSEVSLNLRGLQIRKLETVPAGAPATQSTALFIDNNLIKTLPTIDAYKKLTKISASDNQIDSLIWFGRLPSLQYLNLARNKVKDIQGLWKLCLGHLTHVDLSGNEIKVLRGHSGVYKIQLEILDLSANQIGAIENLSMLTNLKELFLHQNQIQSLAECKTNLPVSLTKLTLAENSILSLGDVAELSRLENLHSLSLRQNLCTNVLQIVDSGHNPVCPPKFFDYRPYVLTWCPNLVSLDERPLSDQEKLKAEWLLSEGKTRETSAEKHAALVTYLSNVCPSLGPQNTFTQSQPEGHIQGQSYGHATSGQVKAESVLSHPKLTGSSGDIGTLSTSLMQVPLPVNNNTVKFVSSLKPSNNKSGLKSTHPSEITRNNVCSTGCPCKHYIELIEEKAKNHKLLRKTESLEMDNEMLMQRVQLLEDSLSQNGFDLDQLNVKIEEEEE